MTNKQEFENQMNDLANAINTKAGSTGQKTIAQLQTTVESIPGITVTVNQDNTIDLTIG